MAKIKNKNLVPKLYRDISAYQAAGKPWPAKEAPFCIKCDLWDRGSATPFMPPAGADEPLITFVMDAPSRKEDASGVAGGDGPAAFIRRLMAELPKEIQIPDSKIRWAHSTRCAIIHGKGNPKTGGKWCRNYLFEDLTAHRPGLIVPLGSTALGLLNHKSNAMDWGGRLLTYRGWPDDWIVDPKFELGHPVYGQRPGSESHVPLMPLQAPKIVWGSRVPSAIAKWKEQFKQLVQIALTKPKTLVYDRPWWKITEDPNEVAEALLELIENPGTIVTYDTETTGLKPFIGTEKIVFMMIRWSDKAGNKKALGWPWDFSASDKPAKADPSLVFNDSAIKPYIPDLAPFVLRALAASKLRGHNLDFDLKFTIATLPGGLTYLDKLCEAFHEDTWHMRYVLRQERGSIGLEIVAYDWAPSLAGYEEEMTLLIERYKSLMHPEEGGHYANCPRKFWQSHFRPYVMGDVEVCHEAAESMGAKLLSAPMYKIPLASPTELGKFRWYTPQSRDAVYRKIIAPASTVLSKMMARGMHIDAEELTRQEKLFPTLIRDSVKKLRESDPRISTWCNYNEAQTAHEPEGERWTFDLNAKDVLKECLFGENVLNLPIDYLTDSGTKVYKTLDGVPKADLLQYASTDKFTLNALAVNHPQVRPLLDFRSLCKQYSSYVRPMRNIFTPGIDKNERDRYPILMADGSVHASFKVAGTRTGRLACCVDGDTMLDVKTLANGVCRVKISEPDSDAVVGTFIKSHSGKWRRILSRSIKGYTEMFEVVTEAGRKITCTLGHRFLTGHGWKELGDISIGEKLAVDTDFNSCGTDQHDAVKFILGVGLRQVWDIEVEKDHSYCAEGFINHNSEPNLQQVPRDGIIKKLFSSRFGKERGCIYQGDLSQIELRLLAAACGDPKMVKAYRDGVDLHSLTTSLVFKLPYEHFTEPYEVWLQQNGRADEAKKLKGKRKLGKTLNFLTGYGGGAFGFQSAMALQGVYLQIDECEKLLNGFFESYPYMKTHIGLYKNFVQKNGVAVSLTGRVRVLEEVFSEDQGMANKALRAAYNHLIQASASDLLLLCLVAIERLMRLEGLESVLVSTVHDSLVIDGVWDEVPKIHEICDAVLSNIPEVAQQLQGPEADLSWMTLVPLSGDCAVGRNYSQETKIPAKNPDFDEIKRICFAAN